MGKTENDFSRPHGWTNFTMCFTREVVAIMQQLDNGTLYEAQEVAKNARKLEFVGLGLSLISLLFCVAIFTSFRYIFWFYCLSGHPISSSPPPPVFKWVYSRQGLGLCAPIKFDVIFWLIWCSDVWRVLKTWKIGVCLLARHARKFWRTALYRNGSVYLLDWFAIWRALIICLGF